MREALGVVGLVEAGGESEGRELRGGRGESERERERGERGGAHTSRAGAGGRRRGGSETTPIFPAIFDPRVARLASANLCKKKFQEMVRCREKFANSPIKWGYLVVKKIFA